MIRASVGQLVPCAANRPVARHEVIKKVLAGSGKYRSSTPVSTLDSLMHLLTDGQQRWRARARIEFSVEMYPPVLLCFQTE